MAANDLIRLEEDDRPLHARESGEPPPWRILIVDDDEQVHLVTRYALRGTRILGRRLEFDSAYSASEARELLARRRYSLILLDVVMESEDAGLRLVGEIRERFEDPAVRIVLRTGQPGFAPELEVIQNYDINDYRAKSELTTERLITSLTAALRAYQQICAIEEHRRRLETVLGASSELLRLRTVPELASGVLAQVCRILELPPQGVLCVSEGGELPPRVLAALGADLEGDRPRAARPRARGADPPRAGGGEGRVRRRPPVPVPRDAAAAALRGRRGGAGKDQRPHPAPALPLRHPGDGGARQRPPVRGARAPGLHRPAHRPAQPRRARAAARRAPRRRRSAGAALRRHRQLPGGERRSRPPGRRPHAEGRGRAAPGVLPRGAGGGEALRRHLRGRGARGRRRRASSACVPGCARTSRSSATGCRSA
ncbi:MAG: DUF3369 domain-containing protein [Xanthomonadales bacterium]|nr:DUF3369 domain-containing protein [Xanthomonadales bacterium]